MKCNNWKSLIRLVFMKHQSIVLMSLGVGALAFAAPAVSRADVLLFSNFAAGFSYNTGLANIVGNDFVGDNLAEGDSFKSSASATFNAISIALSCSFGCLDSFVVSLTADSGDSPGSALESFNVPGGSLGPFGSNNPPLILNSVSHPFLTGGTQYWVTVTNDGNDAIGWNLNSTGDVNDEAISADGGSTWFSPGALGLSLTPGALQVSGSVPEPAAVGLLATVLLLLGARGVEARE
jgi:hypothetical protein